MEPSAVSCKQPGGGLLWVQPEEKHFPRAILWASPAESTTPVHHACTGLQGSWGQPRDTLLPTCLLQAVIHGVHGSCWGNLCSRHPSSRECSSRCARDAGWGSWRDRDNWVPNPNFTFIRLSLPFAGDEPFQDGPKPMLGDFICIPPIRVHLLETFDVQKLSSLRSPNVASQEILTVRLSMKEKEKLLDSKNIISTVVNVLTICKRMI